MAVVVHAPILRGQRTLSSRNPAYTAGMSYQVGKYAAQLHYGVGAAIGGLGTVALQLLLDKDLRHALIDKGTDSADRQAGGVHPAVIQNAAKLEPLLNKLDPQKARIGIGGAPGTGKTQLATELSKRLGMQHHDADIGFGLRSIPEGSISDHYSTLVHEDPEQFDAMIHLKRPGATRGAGGDPIFKLRELDEASTQQFDAARGKERTPAPGVRLKLRPPEGFGTKPLDQSFVNKGYIAKKLAPGVLGSVAGAIVTHLLRRS